ncbi:hypothetical protein PV10_04578 [Exophiala mesophila]|uniref:Cullin family profile domain-containing protein n=1 Tax=Exophiala mesophila TaxID=212818 RepID=A0A0D1XYP1_EXOME|nr:uncharacterized protein PV10_04578 [Exophiala mesophila]KIV93361.1 hypothetical protein PV10_04578 [Exophiala mesophila]
MTRARKAKAVDRGTPSKLSAKRKTSEDNTTSATSPKRPRTSIPDLFSSKQNNGSDVPSRTVGGVGKRSASLAKMETSIAQSPKSSFANMYSFSSKTPSNAVVDLTSSPDSTKRKLSFATPRPSTFNPNQGPKKLIVKNLRTVPRIDPQQYFDSTWAKEDKALNAIFAGSMDSYSLEELYKGSENICRQGKAAELYKKLKNKLESHLTDNVQDGIRRDAAASSDVEVLRSFLDSWSTWQKQMLTVRQIFYYLDQTYLLRSQENPGIIETGLIGFRSAVFEDRTIQPKVLAGILALFASDRKGLLTSQDFTLLGQAIDMLHQLSIYTSHFEPLFRQATEEYLKQWLVEESHKDDLGQYVNACSELLVRETSRCEQLNLDRSTQTQITELFDQILVEDQTDTLSDDDSLQDLLEENKFDELKRVYTLLQRKGYGDRIGPSFYKYVETEGSLIVFDEKKENEMIVRLLEFKRRLDKYLNYSFNGNEKVGNGLHKSFELFMNKTKKTQSNWDTDNSKPGEMIAKHVDLLLKGGVKAVPQLQSLKLNTAKPDDEHDFDDGPADEDAEINQHLSDALDLFRFIHGKAVFEAFYKKDLARRLLMGRSSSFDAERNMLTRLKNECGASFTHNLESMFKDMNLAREDMMSYNQLLDDRGTKSDGPDLNVNVLSAAAWPTYPDVAVNIPKPIAKVMDDFETHYKAKHSGRKLVWKHSLAHCQLRAKFPKGNKELVVSGFQAIVLLLFNDIPADKALTYTEIKDASGLVDAELKRTLQSLACAKYQVLKKHPKGRDVNATDTFTFSTGFQDPKMRIKINQIQLKETKEENKETHQRVAADRHYETQAAIVRIMKSKKKIGHNELIVEVIKATMSRGVLDQTDIKRNIEKLIEKDYMEREEGNTYAYVA